MRSLCIYLRSEFGYIFYLFYIIIILNLCGKIRKFNINKFILYYLIIKKWMIIIYNYFFVLFLVY